MIIPIRTHRSAGNRSLFPSFLRMLDHDDVVAVGRDYPDQPDRVRLVEPVGLLRWRKRSLQLDNLGRAAGFGRLRLIGLVGFIRLIHATYKYYRLTVCQHTRLALVAACQLAFVSLGVTTAPMARMQCGQLSRSIADDDAR